MVFTTTPHLPLQLFFTILIIISKTVSLQGRTESPLGNTKIRLSRCKSCFILMILTVAKKKLLKIKGQSNYMYIFLTLKGLELHHKT